MHPAKELPELVDLQQAFRYDPETGKLYWTERPDDHFLWDQCAHRAWNSVFPGKEAGVICYQKSTGRIAYVSVSTMFFGFKYKMMAHRIVLALHGIRPAQGMVVDHIDGDASNNRFENLRVCTHAQNIMNSAKYRHYRGRERTLPRGVTKEPRCERYRAQISINGKRIYLGIFPTPEEAYEVFKAKAQEMHGEFFRPD